MGAFKSFVIVAAFGLLSAAVAATAQGLPGYKTFTRPAAEPQAPALPPARAPARPTAWVQRDATIDLDKPFADDPLGTNVYADTKYAPANVRAAIENKDEDPTAAVWAKPAPQPVGGLGMGAGMGGGMGAGGVGMGAGDSAAMLQQSYSPSAPVATAPSNDVFTGGSNGFNNRYQASVQNAMGSSDLMVQMIVEAPEQQVALGSDIIRQLMGQRVNTMPNRIFVYSTRTINNPKGEPFTAITYLMKNNLDVERWGGVGLRLSL